MLTPKVSVILPTYNRASLVTKAIQNALDQTWKDLEVVVVDDGSCDNTFRLVKDLALTDSRVRYVRQENQGVSAARNRALAEAVGEYIAFLDSDDLWRPWKVEVQLAIFHSMPHLGMVWTNMDAIRTDGTLLKSNYLRRMYSAYSRIPGGSPFASVRSLGTVCPQLPDSFSSVPVHTGKIYTPMFRGNLVHTSTVMLRREWVRQVGSFDVTMRRGGEDFKFHLATCRLGHVALLDAPAVLYRVGGEDAITARQNNVHFARSYLRTIQDELARHRAEVELSDSEINGILAEAHQWVADEQLRQGCRTDVWSHALSAIWLRRSIGPAWKTLVKSVLPPGVLEHFRGTRAASA